MRQKLEELTGEKIEVEPSRNEMVGTCYEFCKKKDCSSNCILYRIGSCSFKNYSDEKLKECYENVIADGNKLKVGDTIKCAISEEMVDIMMALAKEGIDTDFRYEKDGEHGLWLEIVEVMEDGRKV